MPWFKIDDSSHSHPKFIKAGNAAIGLFVRCGAYSAQHLTEGIVPGVIAQLYGTGPQAAKLVKVGLWHGTDHECPRCPQPGPGDYVIHDFFEGGRNSTRAQVEASRKRATERQARHRAKGDGEENAFELPTKSNRFAGERSEKRDRFDPHFSGSTAGQDMPSQRDAIDSVTPPQAKPYQASPTEKPASKAAGPQVPDFAADLVEQLTAAGMVVGWRLTEPEWFKVHAHIKRTSIPAMVEFARRRWNPADPPQTARYLTRIWSDMPDVPTASDGLPVLRAVDAPPSKHATYLASMAAIADELRQAGGA